MLWVAAGGWGRGTRHTKAQVDVTRTVTSSLDHFICQLITRSASFGRATLLYTLEQSEVVVIGSKAVVIGGDRVVKRHWYQATEAASPLSHPLLPSPNPFSSLE